MLSLSSPWNIRMFSKQHAHDAICIRTEVFFPKLLDPIEEITTTTNLDMFENPMAEEVFNSEQNNKSSSSDGEGHDSSDSSESDQDTSLVIKNPFPKKRRHKHLTGFVSKASPLLFHQPKASPIPPAKVPGETET